MFIKLKDGYSAEVKATGGNKPGDILRIITAAKDAIKAAKDAELTKEIRPGVSFQITKLKAAVKENDVEAIHRELDYLKRDVKADLEHKNYPDMYRQAVLEKIVTAYKDALAVAKTAITTNEYDDLAKDIATLEMRWIPAKFSFVNEQGKTEMYDTLEDAIDRARQISAMTSKEIDIMNEQTGEIHTVKADRTLDSCKAKDATTYVVWVKDGEQWDKYCTTDDPRKAYDIANNLYKLGWDDTQVTYMDEAVKDDCKADGKVKDACKSKRKVKDVDNLRVCAHCLAGIEAHEGKMITDTIYAEDDEDLVCDWCGEGNNTELYEIIGPSRHRTYDAPPPYYDPDDAPRIVSKYSPDRILKEIAHSEEGDAILGELEDVIEEIDEFIKKGRGVLQESGWTREDARRAIRERYYTFVTALREADRDDIADNLAAKINKLEKAWGLVR